MPIPSLNPHQLDSFSKTLHARYTALKRKAALHDATEPGSVVASGEVHDMKDEAAADALAEVQSADRRRDEQELSDIERALARIDAGTYGSCVDCGEAIGLDRLKAYPTAKRCHRCQEVRERRPGAGSAPGR